MGNVGGGDRAVPLAFKEVSLPISILCNSYQFPGSRVAKQQNRKPGRRFLRVSLALSDLILNTDETASLPCHLAPPHLSPTVPQLFHSICASTSLLRSSLLASLCGVREADLVPFLQWLMVLHRDRAGHMQSPRGMDPGLLA